VHCTNRPFDRLLPKSEDKAAAQPSKTTFNPMFFEKNLGILSWTLRRRGD
jgi:hypothetical protein